MLVNKTSNYLNKIMVIYMYKAVQAPHDQTRGIALLCRVLEDSVCVGEVDRIGRSKKMQEHDSHKHVNSF